MNLPKTAQKRVVIVGAGFAGLTLARRLSRDRNFQIVLVDKNNYHQFQPLFYQVAMAGLEPSSIVFPLRKSFQHSKNVFIRVTKVLSVSPEQNQIETEIGTLDYDFLVLATGADTNFFGNEQVRANAIPMKSVSEALFLRNTVFEDFEKAVVEQDEATRQQYLDIVIVGGGPTGVEVAGALGEMKKHILQKEYPDFDAREMEIHLVHSGERLLNTMSEQAGAAAKRYLEELGVSVMLGKRVKDFDGSVATMTDGSTVVAKKLIWAAGISGNLLAGLPAEAIAAGNRLKVNAFNRLEGAENIFVVGDLASQLTDERFPNGHPQVAQVAIQQAKLLAKNLPKIVSGGQLTAFEYRDLGSLATIGRHRAVADLPGFRFQGAFAWFVWLFVHLFAILGLKNKVFVFLNWVWNYLTYDQSLRLVIKPWRRDLKK